MAMLYYTLLYYTILYYTIEWFNVTHISNWNVPLDSTDMILKSKEPPSAVCIWLAPRNDTAEASTNDILAGHWMSAGAQQALVFHFSMFFS